MSDWRRGYMVIGAALCISGALAQYDPLLLLGTAFVTSAGLQGIVIGSVQAAESAGAGDSNVLAAGVGEPRALVPRASKRPVLTLGHVPDVAYAPFSVADEEIASGAESAPVALSVLVIQQALLRLGHDPGPTDGHMGPKTHAAIVAYEELMGWKPSGLVSLRLHDSLITGPVADERPGLPLENVLGPSVALEGTTFPIAVEPRPIGVDAAFRETAHPIVSSDDTMILARASRIENPRGALEIAIVEAFNALRDTSLYLVRFFSGSAPREITHTPSVVPIHGHSVDVRGTE